MISVNSIKLLFIKKNNFFKIHIFDNASTDSTRKIFIKYKNIFSSLRYTRQKKNLGTAKNILSAFSKTNTNFIWIFGDDDRINLNGFKIIKKIITKKKNSITGLTLNNNFCNKPEDIEIYNEKLAKSELIKFNIFSKLSRLGQVSCQIFNLKIIKKYKIHKNINSKIVYPHLEIWKRLYNLNNNWKFCKNEIVNILRHQIDYNNLNKKKQLEGFKWKDAKNLKTFLASRLRSDVKEYSNCIESLNLGEKYKIRLYNMIFSKIFRPWIIENLLYDLEVNNIITKFQNKLDFKNFFTLKLICFSPRFIIRFIVIFKRNLL